MITGKEVVFVSGVALGAVIEGALPSEWPIWQEVAMVALACAILYVIAKVAFRSQGNGVTTD